MKTIHKSACTNKRSQEATGGVKSFSDIQLNPTAYAYYHFKWAVQEIADWCTRILFWANISDEEVERCFDELKDYLPVRREELMKCLNGETPEEGLLRLLGQALD